MRTHSKPHDPELPMTYRLLTVNAGTGPFPQPIVRSLQGGYDSHEIISIKGVAHVKRPPPRSGWALPFRV